MIKHLSSKTDVNAANRMKSVKEGRSREIVVLKTSLAPQLELLKPSLLQSSMRNELLRFKQQVWMLAILATHRLRFVDFLLKRVALYHQLISHGKMHSVAHHTAKDLKPPFRVTNTYAH